MEGDEELGEYLWERRESQVVHWENIASTRV
jgi:hypothetical protein